MCNGSTRRTGRADQVLDLVRLAGLAAYVIAVEPCANLAAILAATHACDLPGGFLLAVAATSLHWLDPVTAIAKIAGLVRPGGWLAAWWNEFGDTNRPTPFRDRLDDVYHDPLPAEPGFRSSRAHVFDTDRWRHRLSAGGWFDDVTVDDPSLTVIYTAAGTAA